MYSTKLIHFSETACSTAPQNAIWPSPFECFATGYNNNNNRISQRQCKMVRQVPLNSAQWCVSWPGAPHWVACLRTHNPDWPGRRWVPGLRAASVLPISFESRWVQEEKGVSAQWQRPFQCHAWLPRWLPFLPWGTNTSTRDPRLKEQLYALLTDWNTVEHEVIRHKINHKVYMAIWVNNMQTMNWVLRFL